VRYLQASAFVSTADPFHSGVDVEHLTKVKAAVSLRETEYEAEKRRRQEEEALFAATAAEEPSQRVVLGSLGGGAVAPLGLGAAAPR
jgi:hypothetical protein